MAESLLRRGTRLLLKVKDAEQLHTTHEKEMTTIVHYRLSNISLLSQTS